jgi:hypothetical protein
MVVLQMVHLEPPEVVEHPAQVVLHRHQEHQVVVEHLGKMVLLEPVA